MYTNQGREAGGGGGGIGGEVFTKQQGKEIFASTLWYASQVGGVTVGQRNGFSRGDIKKLRAMYKCEGKKSKL